jgi:hypothetical protein
MKFIIYICEMLLALVAMLIISVAANTLFGPTVGLLISVVLIVSWNVVRYAKHKLQSATSNEFQSVPGKIGLQAKTTLGFNLNGREFVLGPGEKVEVKIPDTCTGLLMRFTEEDKGTDTILDATELEA